MAAALLIWLVGNPLYWLLASSLSGEGGLTLQNYLRVFTHGPYYSALANTLTIGAASAALSVLVGVPMAWAVARTDMPAREWVRALVNVSYMTPAYLTAIAYVILLGPNAGLINRLLRQVFHLETGVFNIFSLPGIILVTLFNAFPVVFYLTSSALESLDASLEQSALILGTSRLRTTLLITLPLVAPAILSGALLAFVHAISLFGSHAILGIPRQIFTLPTRIYSLFSYPPDYAAASTLSLVLIVLTVIGLYLQRGFLERKSYVTMAGKGVRAELIRLGRWRWGALAFCGAVFVAAVLLPYGVLLVVSLTKAWGKGLVASNFTLAHYRFVLFEYSLTKRAMANSLLLAGGAATLSIVLGALIAYLDLRTRAVGRKLLDYIALIPLGLPGIVLAVGLVMAWIRSPVPVYGTMAIILIAYMTRYIPLAIRSANASLRQVDPALEEAVRVTGGSWFSALANVTLPLMKSGLTAGWVMVFASALHELSATVLLFTSGTETIAIAIFQRWEEGVFEAVCALSIITMIVTSLSIWLARRVAGKSAVAASA